MITMLICDNQEKIRQVLISMLSKVGNTKIGIIKEQDTIKIADKESLAELVSLKDKIIELEDLLYNENKGVLYRAVLEAVEKPLIEHTLERADGNQLKAAKILGINRNTIRAKIKKFGILPYAYKNAHW